MAGESGQPVLTVRLRAGEYALQLAPERGGSILRLDWRGKPLLRPVCGDSILDVASFPLVPFSNRIAFGRFRHGAHEVALQPNFPGTDHPHALHGFGWLAPWQVARSDDRCAVLTHDYPGGEWPWRYRAQQIVALNEHGLDLALSVTNLAEEAMPTGLGFHPYFLRDAETAYLGLHRGEWITGDDGLPLRLAMRDRPHDWWEGAPIGARHLDTVYAGRQGKLVLTRPRQGHRITIVPSANLPYTVVYVPAGEGHFCVEPVSHPTDAINRVGRPGLRWLEPGEIMTVHMTIRAESWTAC